MPDSDSSTSRPAPRNRRFSGLAMVVVALLSAGLATGVTLFVKRAPVGSDNGENVGSSDAKHGDLYQCPMHPTITQDKPGDCPICGMKLVLQASSADTAATVETKGKSKVLYYRSPMDPTQTSKEPRKDTMGMDYVPVYEEEVGSSSSVEGMASVRIDPSRQQLIGLRTATATRGSVGGEWRTVGRVSVDETRVRRINIKVPAYVEDIYVDFVGKTVSKGAPLFSVYSPDLQSAQEELLLALRSQPVATELENFAGGGSMVAAARRKLELWDVPEVEVQKVEATKKPLKAVTFYSPIAGVVTKKEVVEGTQLSVGAMPYEIVDLSRVWVLADVYESELRNVRMGMPATLTLKAFPNRTFEGKVSFIAPLLDPVTRTVSVRLAFANPSGELRPDMFGEVILKAPTRDALRIPMDAVIDSGSQSVVFLALGQGKFASSAERVGVIWLW